MYAEYVQPHYCPLQLTERIKNPLRRRGVSHRFANLFLLIKILADPPGQFKFYTSVRYTRRLLISTLLPSRKLTASTDFRFVGRSRSALF